MSRVYFIRPIGMAGPVKIGFSKLPSYRLKSLQTWSPFELEVAADMAGSLTLERRFHNLFKADHTHREWFRWSPALELVIQAVKAGTFDIAALPDMHMPLHQQTAVGRDRSYDTPGHRYAKSVSARIMQLRKRGLPWTDPVFTEIGFKREWGQLSPEELEAKRREIEPKLEELSNRFPKANNVRLVA